MSYFLWVEDFENEPKVTASNVFAGVLDEDLFSEDKRVIKKEFKQHGVFVELNFQDGLAFIRTNLDKIDYIILDIDLPAYGVDGIDDHVLQLLKDFEGYQADEDEKNDEVSLKNTCNELKKIAGFYLYTKLVVELGFPKQHILFCSNHGDNTKTIQDAFKTAKIALPKIYLKSDPDVQTWVKERHENAYSRLRRGIFDACNYLESHTDNPEFKEYFFGLKKYLPLKEPDANEKRTLYLHLARAIVHDWDDKGHKIPDRASNPIGNSLGYLLRTSRNWLAHDSLLTNFDEKTIAFIFLLNIRMLVNLADVPITSFEDELLSIFNKSTATEDEVVCNLKEFYREAIEISKNNEINFINRFYNQMVNDFHENKLETLSYTNLLFRLFMFSIYKQTSSFPKLVNTENKNSPFLDYQVKFVKRENLPAWLVEFGSHFYSLAIDSGQK